MSAYTIRPLRRRDVPAAQSIRRSAGWNQTDADWTRLLDLNPDGCFAIDLDGVLAATATTTVYGGLKGHGGSLAWVGMVLVRPESRRRGLATCLLERCLDHVTSDRSIECVKLDATPDGETVYAKFGFRREAALFRWRGMMADMSAGNDASSGERGHSSGERGHSSDKRGASSGKQGDSSGMAGDTTGWQFVDRDGPWSSIDRAAFGVDRVTLLRRLASGSLKTVVVEEPDRDGDSLAFVRQPAAGFGMLREGSVARYLGPVVARNETIGRRIVHQLVGRGGSNRDGSNRVPVYWDIPECNRAAGRLAEELGFVRDRSLIRMWYGRKRVRGNPAMQWAIAGPETG